MTEHSPVWKNPGRSRQFFRLRAQADMMREHIQILTELGAEPRVLEAAAVVLAEYEARAAAVEYYHPELQPPSEKP